jgi:hypothetical protein
MSYLQDSWKYQPNSTLYKLESTENNLKRGVYMLNMQSLKNHTPEIKNNLKNAENSFKDLSRGIKGINWYAFLFGFAVYYTQHLFRNKVLLNEMNVKALPHIGVCTAVGLAFGAFVGYSTGSNFTLYRKFKAVDRTFRRNENFIKSQ